MFFQIAKLNLELSLFVKELTTYADEVNETDDKTHELLIEAITAINALEANSVHRRAAQSKPKEDKHFLDQLDNIQFECRRHIMCCLCHVSRKKCNSATFFPVDV